MWTAEELQQLGEICLRHHVIVVSDEIHNDFVYPGYEHTVFATVDPRFAEFTVTCTAPSKTFNLAGLQISNILSPMKSFVKHFRQRLTRPVMMNLMHWGSWRVKQPIVQEKTGWIS